MRALNDEMPQTRGDFVVAASSDLFGGLIQFLVTIVLTGIITVVVGRSVFGSTISIGEAWQRIRGRLLPLIAIALLETAGAVVLFGATGLVIASLAMAANGFAAFAVGVPLVLAVMALVVWLATMLYLRAGRRRA